MLKQLSRPFILLAWVTGCTSTHEVSSENAEQWIHSAQEQLLGEDVSIRTFDNKRYSGTLIRLSPDSVTLAENGQLVVTEVLSNVAFVGEPPDIVSPILGSLAGCMIGALAGGAIAAGNEGGPESDKLIEGFAGGAVGGVLGTVVGGVIGGLTSTVDQYELQPPGE